MYSLFTRYFFFLSPFLFFAAFSLQAQQSKTPSEHLHIEPPPQWVIERSPTLADTIPVDEISDGVFYQLVDKQIQVEKNGFRTSYSRFIETTVNQTGVEDSSQINLEFDPSYQKLTLNTLTVIRDGKPMDRLSEAQISVFSRETDLDQQIYSGRLTLNILLDDIQTGDTLDYSYTRYGSNPVYKNIFSFSHNLNWNVPVYNQHIRVLWGKPKALNLQSRNLSPDIITSQFGAFTEYQINLQNQASINVPSQIPRWYSPYGKIYFNEVNNWQEVVAWAQPMYHFGPTQPAIAEVAKQIEQTFSTKSGQIEAALKYVQNNIRYVGLEMGENSHLPTAPEETLALKYGDCKDKASLLIAILQALNIEAYPALVETQQTKLLAELPPSPNVFNHVIVWLDLAGTSFWLDPTLSNQKGNLTNLYQPDYGYALILKEGIEQLTAMHKNESQDYRWITEKYLLPEANDSPVIFSASATYKGYEAMKQLWKLEQDGKNNVADEYEVYYQRLFPSLTTLDEMTVNINDASGEVRIDERYQIATFWTMGDEDWEADFYPNEVRDAIFKPKQIQRDGPLTFTYPNNIKQTVQIVFEEDGWDFEPEEFSEDNEFFSYYSSVGFENNTLTIQYQFSAKTDHIRQNKMDEYLDARSRVRKDAYYGIIKYVEVEHQNATDDNGSEIPNWLIIIALVYGLGMLFIIVDWQIESRQRPVFSESQFYPIAVWKFVILSTMSFGIYNSYWMYRNWQTIKVKTQEHIMPFWRGIFAIFWLYPFFLRLKQDSQVTFQTNKVIATWLAASIAVAYCVFAFISNYADDTTLTLLFLITTFLLLPFVRYINLRNEQTPDALHFNTKWRIRHYVTLLLMTPLMLLTVATETPLLPSDAVVTQSQLWERDLKFFYRQKLMPANEKIAYFYSDAFLDIKKDGNGFTENRVFSYWQDENGSLQKEIAAFNEIENIDVEFSDSDLDNTIVTITRKDKSDFMLFISKTEKGDQLFVDELKKRWEAQKQ